MGCCNQPKPLMPIGVNPPAYPGPACSTPCKPCVPVPPVPPKPNQCNLPCDQTVFRRVQIPATLGDDTTLPPSTLEYRNVILEYEFNGHVYIYSSDGIPTLISNGTGTNFNDLTNRPMYNGQPLTGLINIPEVPTSIADLSDAARITCIESTNQALKQSYEILNGGLAALNTTVDAHGDTLKTLQQSIDTLDCKKQDKLVGEGVGQNIKTVNGFNLLGEGNVEITLDSAGVQPLLVSGENIKTVNGESILGAGDIELPTAKLYDVTGENTDGALTQKFASEQFDSLNEEIATLSGYAEKEVQINTKIADDKTSTVTIVATTAQLNGTTATAKELPLPVASATQAGVINPAMYEQLQDATEKIEVLLAGSVADPTLPENPTDEQLTEAWKAATGKTELINGAKITGADGKTYIYYANTGEWQLQSESGGAIEINPFTNDSAGTIIGNDVDGGVVSDGGKGSVKGWDTVKAGIANNTSALQTAQDNIAVLQNTVGEKQDRLIGTGENQNIKTVNGENLLGTGNITTDDPRLTDATVSKANRLPDRVVKFVGIATNETTGEVSLNFQSKDLAYDVATPEEYQPIPVVTSKINGLMSIADKAKLDALDETVTANTAAIATNKAAIEANTALIGDVDALLTKLDTGAGVN